MAEIATTVKRHPEAARALVGGSMISCPGCGKALTGRQRACSGRCRAILSRRKRIPVKVEDLRAIRSLVKMTLEGLWEAKATLDRYVGG